MLNVLRNYDTRLPGRARPPLTIHNPFLNVYPAAEIMGPGGVPLNSGTPCVTLGSTYNGTSPPPPNDSPLVGPDHSPDSWIYGSM